jgi:hypothetical protein
MVSCASKKAAVNPEVSTLFHPSLKEISNAELGISLVTKEQGLSYDAIEITKEFKVEQNNNLKVIEAGQIFINNYTTEKYDLYSIDSDSTHVIAIPKIEGNPMISTSNDTDGIYSTGFSQFGMNFTIPVEKIEYTKRKVIVKNKDYFKQEFIYNGRVGDALKFAYREYINDYARPAFTQDLRYDLSETKIIGFRGLRIEVLNATNTEIQYKVINYFEK